VRERTPFERRCDQAWHNHPGEDLRLSLHVLRRDSEVTATYITNLYVVYDASADAVKIGVTRTPKPRLSNLQLGTSHPLERILAVPARAGLEQVLHGYLASDRIRGEWFRLTPRVLVAIELLLSAEDFHRDALRDGEEPEHPDLTTEVLCSRANDLLDALEAAA
jgi:hypothetical protein